MSKLQHVQQTPFQNQPEPKWLRISLKDIYFDSTHSFSWNIFIQNIVMYYYR